LPLGNKSREANRKTALRSRTIFLATSLLGVAALTAVGIESVAAHSVEITGPRTKAAKTADTSSTSNASSSNAVGNLVRVADAPDKPAGDSVGTIEGDAIALQGPMSVQVVRGQVKTMLHSGSDIRVKSGQARIDLVEGGTIAICGPAHVSLLKSGGSLTIALDSGVVHVHIDSALNVTV
jgi:hypothetical protein